MKNNEPIFLVTGAKGLLGNYIVEVLTASNKVYFAFDKFALDITNPDLIEAVVSRTKPTHIINCAAYTNVAKAEEEKELCYKINVEGVKNITTVANKKDIELVQISTDYVFDGKSSDGKFHFDSIKNPLNYYGYTKSIAEDYVMYNAKRWKIIRTSWVFGDSPNNFVNRILRQSYDEKLITMNNIEIGVPTFGYDLAQGILEIISHSNGIFHLTNSGFASRYEYTKYILGNSTKSEVIINNDLSKGVIRPEKVLLVNNTNIELRHWKDALNDYLSRNT
jgi:dTDP-4-dehydrorhamnose reductase